MPFHGSISLDTKSQSLSFPLGMVLSTGMVHVWVAWSPRWVRWIVWSEYRQNNTRGRSFGSHLGPKLSLST